MTYKVDKWYMDWEAYRFLYKRLVESTMSRVQEWRTMGEREVVAHVLFDTMEDTNALSPMDPFLLNPTYCKSYCAYKEELFGWQFLFWFHGILKRRKGKEPMSWQAWGQNTTDGTLLWNQVPRFAEIGYCRAYRLVIASGFCNTKLCVDMLIYLCMYCRIHIIGRNYSGVKA